MTTDNISTANPPAQFHSNLGDDAGRLVLSRRENDRIDLVMPDGTLVEIHVVGFKGQGNHHRARVMVIAPESVKILRGELADRATEDFVCSPEAAKEMAVVG